MKFTVSSTAMANKLAAMAKVMNGKSVLPILSTFLLEVKEDAPLEVTASDLECVWHGSLEITGQEGTGKVCIPASTLLAARQGSLILKRDFCRIRVLQQQHKVLRAEADTDVPSLMNCRDIGFLRRSGVVEVVPLPSSNDMAGRTSSLTMRLAFSANTLTLRMADNNACRSMVASLSLSDGMTAVVVRVLTALSAVTKKSPFRS